MTIYKKMVFGEKEMIILNTCKKREYLRAENIMKFWNLLKKNGSLFLVVEAKNAFELRIEMDKLVGRDNFINEIIVMKKSIKHKKKWAEGYRKILWFAKDFHKYIFNFGKMDRIPYMSGAGLVGEKKFKKGKTPTNVWLDIFTEKEILKRLINVHSTLISRVLILPEGK